MMIIHKDDRKIFSALPSPFSALHEYNVTRSIAEILCYILLNYVLVQEIKG